MIYLTLHIVQETSSSFLGVILSNFGLETKIPYQLSSFTPIKSETRQCLAFLKNFSNSNFLIYGTYILFLYLVEKESIDGKHGKETKNQNLTWYT